MSSTWGHTRGAERYAVPVEMRFVDMFMAALGALIFMAMLLAFLLKFIPVQGEGTPSPLPAASTLRLLSPQLAPARVGEPYEYPFAYRGGTSAVRWEIVAGARDAAPDLRFDAQQGTLSGTPTAPRSIHFVLRVRDCVFRSIVIADSGRS